MANVFGILTAIVLALTAFVAYKNKDAYANELIHRKDEERKLAASQVRLKIAQDTLAATHKERTATEVVVANLKADEAAQKKVNADLKQEIDSKTQVAENNQKKLDDIREQTKAIGEIRELAQKVKTIRNQMDDLRQSIANNETKLANLTEDNNQTIGRNDVLKGETEMIAMRESFFTKTRIVSIYPNWGFVTLGAGHISGVVTGSSLVISRNGETVGKLLVTAVESNTASASIVPGSIGEGTVLMVGDEVLPTHKSSKSKKLAKPATTKPGAPAAAPDTKPAAAPEPSLEPAAEPVAEPAPAPTAAEPAPAAAESN